jgi:hypothetical protein
MSIGKLENVPLRELWKHEEHNFSIWLEDNIDVLSEALDTSLSVVQREESVGQFKVDLVAENGDGDLVIIENQLEPTNHDHLGKILTYLTNLEAKSAIWITSDPRPEHMRAVAWLNESTSDDISFYIVCLAAYRIGDSDPAPLFTVIVAPSAESKDIGRRKGELAERHVLRMKFWEQLLPRAIEKGVKLHAHRSPSKNDYISVGAGKSGLSFNYWVLIKERTGVDLYIDTNDKERNKTIFDKLYSTRDSIESNFGNALQWQRLDDRRASRISFVISKGGLKDDPDKWPLIQDAMIDAMDRLYKAMMPHLREL